MVLLDTQRLHLRTFAPSDAEVLMAVFGDPEVMRFGDGPRSRAWVEDWLHRCQQVYLTYGYGPYAVVEQSSQQVIGYCGLFYFPDINGRSETEIGYRLRRNAWGRGYASEAASGVRDFAFHTLQIPRLISIIDPGNAGSLRVAQKIGMRYEAQVMLEGYTHPDHVYAVERRSF